jgi:hypothetical protein
MNNMKNTGFAAHPENINRAGRPKRKTLTELIHEKLDREPHGWDELVKVILSLAKKKDKDILKELWHYTDGMPRQSVDTNVSGELHIKKITYKDADTYNP